MCCLCIVAICCLCILRRGCRFFRAFSSAVRQMPGYNQPRRGTIRTIPNCCIVYLLFVLCRSVYCLGVNGPPIAVNKYINIPQKSETSRMAIQKPQITQLCDLLNTLSEDLYIINKVTNIFFLWYCRLVVSEFKFGQQVKKLGDLLVM